MAEKKYKYTKTSDIFVDNIIDEYTNNNLTSKELAIKYCISVDVVRKILKHELGKEILVLNNKYGKIPDGVAEDIINDYDNSKLTIKEISVKYNVTPVTVHNCINNALDRAPTSHRNKRALSHGEKIKIYNDYIKGKVIDSVIMERYGISRGVLSRIKLEYGKKRTKTKLELLVNTVHEDDYEILKIEINKINAAREIDHQDDPSLN